MRMLRSWLVVVAGLFIVAAGPSSPSRLETDPASYSLRLPLTLAGDAPVQHFTVPTAALVASQSEHLSDVRVFDGNGRIAPIARMPIRPPPSQETILPALPILGSSAALGETGVSLKISDKGRVGIISVDGRVLNEDKTTNVVGVLFDTRGQNRDAQRLVVSASLPVGQFITLVVEASDDLKTWRALGEGIVYRPPSQKGEARDEALVLQGTMLATTQLRLTWRSDTPLLAPVAISKAVLSWRPSATEVNRTVSATVSSLKDNYTVEFGAPIAVPIVSIGVDVKASEGLLPLRILGRNNREAPWVEIGVGRAQANSTPILLTGRSTAMIRIEADRRTSGFTAPPAIRFGIAGQQIAFVTTGTPPFTFVSGHPSASDVFLPLETIMAVSPDANPQATLSDPPVGPVVLAPALNSAMSQRNLVLWAVLLAVTALLAGIAWHLWSRRSNKDEPTHA